MIAPAVRNQPARSRGLSLETIGGRFQFLTGLAIVLAILSLLASFFVLSSITTSFNNIVTLYAPSINASQSLGQAIENMDARAADYQLTSRIDVTSPDFNRTVYGADGFRATAYNDLLAQRDRVNAALAEARTKARSQTEVNAVHLIETRFYDYVGKLELMKYELDLGRRENALANYKAAQDILVGNLGYNGQLDAQGRSPEKALKDNNWQQTDFTPVGAAKRSLSFDPNASYNGIAANIKKLSVLNQNSLNASNAANPLLSLIPLVLTVILLLVIGVASVYYAIVTHRVVNIGFGLALITAIVLLGYLTLTVSKAGSDYDNMKNNYVPALDRASAAQQIAADANADLSRLLLSPDSPGLDSTNSILTGDIKQAFAANTLKTSFNNKTKQLATTYGDLGRYAIATNAITTNYDAYIKGATDSKTGVITSYDRNLLANAISTNIDPVRKSYNTFISSVGEVAQGQQRKFDTTACDSIGQSEFGQNCSGSGGYLNQGQFVIWGAFPLLAILMLGGLAYRRNEF